MSTIDDAKWEKIPHHHGNWVPGAWNMHGLRWSDDPGHFNHRALVFRVEDEWHLHVWGNMRPHVVGDWIECGVYKSKRTAMWHARTMAKLFESLRPKEGDDE